MTQVGEGIAVTQVKDPEEDHWAQLEYTYPDGSPVQGMFTAVDGSGMTWTGYLNDQGQACLSGLPPGSVDYQLLPSESLEDELTELRTQIQTVLDGILEEQRAEAKAHQDELDKQSTLGKSVSYTAAVGRGLWNGAIGLLTFAKDVVVKAGELALFMSPVTRMNNLLQASYTSYRNGELTWTDWRESLTKNYQDEEFKDLADLLGIDIRNLDKDEVLSIITEAYEIVAYIADDAEFREMFIQFGKDYAGAQSSIEWAEFAGGGLFEIVLTALLLAFTGGLGNVAQVASKVRHAARLRTLGGMLRKLGSLLQRKKLSQKAKGGVDSKHKVQAEKPEGPKLGSGSKNTSHNGPKSLDDANTENKLATSQRIAKLDQEGHAPIRHGGPNRVNDTQLVDRAVKGIDPASGTEFDAFNKYPDGTPKPHKVGKHATAFTSDEALLQADDFARNSPQFNQNVAAARAKGDIFVDPVEIPLADIFGRDYQSQVRGVIRQGSKKNPTGYAPTDFTDGTIKAIYRLDENGSAQLHTLYPNPKS